MEDSSSMPKGDLWIELDEKKKMNYKIEINQELPNTAFLSKQISRGKLCRPNSYTEFSPKFHYKARQQISK